LFPVRRVAQRKQFRNDVRRQKRRGKDIEELVAAVELLAEEGSLPAAYRPHKLSGEWRGVWECHIEPDWLLIYAVSDEEVLLIRTGTHADLFD
jgi:mRNA interferase YafQ